MQSFEFQWHVPLNKNIEIGNYSTMKIHQLRSLLAIFENGSIQEASRVLHISQPSLSRGIKELESELGVHLLVRSNRGITLTEYGEHLVARARLIVEEVRRAKDEIETLKGSMDGRVTIGVSPVTPSARFVECLTRFRKRHPNVSLQIDEMRPNKLVEALREGRLDLMLTSHGGARNLEGFNCVDLYYQPGALAVRHDHPLRECNSLEQLRELPWIMADSLPESPLANFFEDNNLPAHSNLSSCNSLVMYLELAAKSDAVSYWSLRHLSLGELRTSLKVLHIRESIPGFNMAMVSRGSDYLTREAAALSEEVVYEFFGNKNIPVQRIDNCLEITETLSLTH